MSTIEFNPFTGNFDFTGGSSVCIPKTISYNNSGLVSSIVYSNGVTWSFTYNLDLTINTKADGITTYQAQYENGFFTGFNII